jgi:hypothetical protein
MTDPLIWGSLHDPVRKLRNCSAAQVQHALVGAQWCGLPADKEAHTAAATRGITAPTPTQHRLWHAAPASIKWRSFAGATSQEQAAPKGLLGGSTCIHPSLDQRMGPTC